MSSNSWPIPDGLTGLGRQAAETIVDFLNSHELTEHGGGGGFYTPQAWAARGEQWGGNSLLVVTHDGGDHAGAFNWDYEQDELREALGQALSSIGVFVEQCTSWYSAVYPR